MSATYPASELATDSNHPPIPTLQPNCPADLLELDLKPEHLARYERVHARKRAADKRRGDLHGRFACVESDGVSRFPSTPARPPCP